MPLEQYRAWCPYCESTRLFTRPAPTHLIHLVITLFTCGLWILVWFAVSISCAFGRWTCNVCGCEPGRYDPDLYHDEEEEENTLLPLSESGHEPSPPLPRRVRHLQKRRPVWPPKDRWEWASWIILLLVTALGGAYLLTWGLNQRQNTRSATPAPAATGPAIEREEIR